MDIENENLNYLKSDIALKILYTNKISYDNKNWNTKIKFHPFTEFYYILDGEGRFTIENKVIHVEKDDLIILNPNIGHTETPNEEMRKFEFISFGVDGITVLPQIDIFDKSEKFFIKESIRTDRFFYKELFKSIYEEYNSDRLYSKGYANSIATILIVEILRKFPESIIASSDKKISKQLDYIKSYIDKHYSEDIKLENLASMAYMNKFHLIAEFKSAFRVTPIEYLILKRVDITKSLLITTNHSMEEIANMVGFNSQSYFNQVFRKKVGTTPSKYRKKHRLRNQI
ncbi:MAG: AraC family transcriptional regulator [Peptoniphilaceae bacterium]|nr:AraC family transcriptional regulator [Peptoniphilaceae bacterium]MDD7383851.1 AraC family transcriptional regulator [Peptoniphilaceae bacterium]MDY3738146.1 AraC family transcriptional regulator [Peptoniphilaceae bacterium]MDY6018117.1 AraC family transcriptional regulator [Anaerococcus sp.]